MDSASDSDLSPIDQEFLDTYESEGVPTPLKLFKRKSHPEEELQESEEYQGSSQGEESEASKSDASESLAAPVKKEEEGGLLQVPDSYNRRSQRGRDPEENINQWHDDNHKNYLKVTKVNHWSNPGTPDWDVKRVLESEECLAPDHLLKRPTPDFSYFDEDGKLEIPPQYQWGKRAAENQRKRITGHPKYMAHKKDKTLTRDNALYYGYLPKDRVLPLAGLLDIRERKDPEVRNLERVVANFQENSGLTDAQLQEESFHARPSVHLPIPDHIKAILVDDWENVTKNQQLVPLPAPHSVNSILNDYLAFESPKRQAGTHQADLLLEVVAGLKEYFEKCLGRILLYRFERQQYLEVREGWNSTTGELAGKTALTTYGAEHFCRLLVSLPELLAQTNMDQQSCNRLCEELAKLTIWLGRNATTYFCREYETPGPAYVEKARNG